MKTILRILFGWLPWPLKRKKKRDGSKHSFLVKLKKFNDFPVIIHVDDDCNVKVEFLTGHYPNKEILEEIERIIKS